MYSTSRIFDEKLHLYYTLLEIYLGIFFRVALMVVGYHDCLLGGKDLNGLTDLYLRLLQAKGFKVLIVKHSDIKPGEKTLERVKMIQQKLKTLLEDESKSED